MSASLGTLLVGAALLYVIAIRPLQLRLDRIQGELQQQSTAIAQSEKAAESLAATVSSNARVANQNMDGLKKVVDLNERFANGTADRLLSLSQTVNRNADALDSLTQTVNHNADAANRNNRGY